MELSKQTVSLELAKKLKELGVEQSSFWYWCDILNVDKGWSWQLLARGGQGREFHHAYTTDELGEMLPRYLIKDGLSLELVIIRSSVWRLHYGQPTQKESVVFTAGAEDTEVDTRAKFLIYLIEQGLLPTKE